MISRNLTMIPGLGRSEVVTKFTQIGLLYPVRQSQMIQLNQTSHA